MTNIHAFKKKLRNIAKQKKDIKKSKLMRQNREYAFKVLKRIDEYKFGIQEKIRELRSKKRKK